MKVTVFGEFSRPNMWKVQQPCTFDSFFNCHKSDMIPIKIGDSFKFTAKASDLNGLHFGHKEYLTSKRYALMKDEHQNENNIFEPKLIERIYSVPTKKISNSNSLRESLTTYYETSAYSDGQSNNFNRNSNGGQFLTNQWSNHK